MRRGEARKLARQKGYNTLLLAGSGSWYGSNDPEIKYHGKFWDCRKEVLGSRGVRGATVMERLRC